MVQGAYPLCKEDISELRIATYIIIAYIDVATNTGYLFQPTRIACRRNTSSVLIDGLVCDYRARIDTMTFLEYRRRLQERKRFFGLRSLSTSSKLLLPGQNAPPSASSMRKLLWNYHRNRSKGRRRQAAAQLKSKLYVDVTTCALMKLELGDLLSRNAKLNIETSALAMVNAFIGSKNVLDLYAESTDDNYLCTEEQATGSDHAVLLRRFNGGNLLRRSKRPQMDPTMQRRYEFINAMNELQEYVCLLKEPVTSWDDALPILSRAIQFESERTPVSEAQLFSVESVATDCVMSPRLPLVRSTNDVEVDNYIQRLRSIRLEEATPPGLRISQQKWLEIANAAISVSEYVAKDAEKDSPIDVPRVLVLPVSKEDRDRIHRVMSEGAGNDTDVVAKTEDDTDSVQRYSLRTLRPYEWLNDEVIHYFLATLQRRDVQLCQQQLGRKRTHFFKSFFMTKLLDEGNVNPALDGKYCYNNVKRWSKKVPGVFIFHLVSSDVNAYL
jgi:Ulp1 protease family, C-terminal catalytic domain